jgi:hypothetical protein
VLEVVGCRALVGLAISEREMMLGHQMPMDAWLGLLIPMFSMAQKPIFFKLIFVENRLERSV